MGLLDGKVAMVTGAGRGLGRAHALALAEAGAAVLVNDVGAGVAGGGRDAGVAAGVVEEIRAAGGTAEADESDVASMDGGAALVARAVETFGHLDVVVNNAGISQQAPIVALDEAVLDRHLAVHLKATVGTTRAAFTAMRGSGGSGGGRIVNTVSGAGLDPRHPGSAAYACAKAAVYAFTKVAAVEGAEHGIAVNAVSPLALTRMSERYFAGAEPSLGARLDPSRVSDVVVFLASDLAAGLTGRILRVEGGHVSEAFMDRTPGVDADHWDPDTLAARMADIIRL